MDGSGRVVHDRPQPRLALTQGALDPFVFGDVDLDTAGACEFAVKTEDRELDHLVGLQDAIGTGFLHFGRVHGAGLQNTSVEVGQDVGRGPEHEIMHLPAARLLQCRPIPFLDEFVDEQIPAVRVLEVNGGRRVVHHRPESGFALLQRHLRELAVGNVRANDGCAAVPRSVFVELHPPAVGPTLFEGRAWGSELAEPLANPLVDPPDGIGIQPAFGGKPEDFLETRAGHHEIGNRRQRFDVTIVAEDQAIVGVIEGETVGDAAHGFTEKGLCPRHLCLGPFQIPDVDVDATDADEVAVSVEDGKLDDDHRKPGAVEQGEFGLVFTDLAALHDRFVHGAEMIGFRRREEVENFPPVSLPGGNPEPFLEPLVDHEVAPFHVFQENGGRRVVHDRPQVRLALAQRHVGAFAFGDVGAQDRGAAALRAEFGELNPAVVGPVKFQWLPRRQMALQPVTHPFPGSPVHIARGTALRQRLDHGFEGNPGFQDIRDFRQGLLQFPIAENQAVVGVEESESVGQAFDSIGEMGLYPGDFGIGPVPLGEIVNDAESRRSPLEPDQGRRRFTRNDRSVLADQIDAVGSRKRFTRKPLRVPLTNHFPVAFLDEGEIVQPPFHVLRRIPEKPGERRADETKPAVLQNDHGIRAQFNKSTANILAFIRDSRSTFAIPDPGTQVLVGGAQFRTLVFERRDTLPQKPDLGGNRLFRPASCHRPCPCR